MPFFSTFGWDQNVKWQKPRTSWCDSPNMIRSWGGAVVARKTSRQATRAAALPPPLASTTSPARGSPACTGLLTSTNRPFSNKRDIRTTNMPQAKTSLQMFQELLHRPLLKSQEAQFQLGKNSSDWDLITKSTNGMFRSMLFPKSQMWR